MSVTLSIDKVLSEESALIVSLTFAVFVFN